MGFEIDGLDKLQEGLKNLVQNGVNELNKGLDRLNNPEQNDDKANVPEVCPYCGARLDNTSREAVIKCDYCGAQFDNSSERTIADSIFDFVEKQQKIEAEKQNKKLEIQRIKAEEKAARRAARRKWAPLRYLVLLVLIVLGVVYYYFNYLV